MTIKDALAEKVWAVIGATHKTDKFGYKIYKCLKEHGYEVYPVNPNVTSIDGDTCYQVYLRCQLFLALLILLYQKQLGLQQLMNVNNWALR